MDRVLIRPNPPSQLNHASASFESPRGIISVAWRRETNGKGIHLKVTIPPNCRATVHFPASVGSSVFDQELTIQDARWVPSLADSEHGALVFEIGSGAYQFQEMKTTEME
jgi:alpha-L-rhamnosidase